MSNIAKYIGILSVVALLVFSYLFYRDVFLKPTTDLNISACTPFGVELEERVVKWKTLDDCVGYVKYGYDANTLDLIAVNEKDSSGFHHEVEISELSSEAYAVIYSNGVAYGNQGDVLFLNSN
jgi:hypothetical protein